ncbi:large conductance mechanosensitive channel protein MscL [Bifidobacterium avesanii]|uniref:Large-conductance mechanosensitive channel n=1 Tax=Bifidobacterium avesanii TaxID=1798157 RepID=A0A7K3TIN8_9BIFI|nr:large conductance mechanosensitive channel protein MscL [Bifidobacterium avesanii]
MAGDAVAATGEVAATVTAATTATATSAARRIAALTDVGPFGGFKKFISRGSMIDMAVGVVMGSAVTGVVNSIVANLINPLIAAIGGQPDMSGILNITLPHNAVISFGSILNAILNFLLIGVAVYFCVILPINKLRDMTASVLDEDAAADAAADAEAEAAKADVSAQTLAVLEEIRDELKSANANAKDAADA